MLDTLISLSFMGCGEDQYLSSQLTDESQYTEELFDELAVPGAGRWLPWFPSDVVFCIPCHSYRPGAIGVLREHSIVFA